MIQALIIMLVGKLSMASISRFVIVLHDAAVRPCEIQCQFYCTVWFKFCEQGAADGKVHTGALILRCTIGVGEDFD